MGAACLRFTSPPTVPRGDRHRSSNDAPLAPPLTTPTMRRRLHSPPPAHPSTSAPLSLAVSLRGSLSNDSLSPQPHHQGFRFFLNAPQ